MGLRSRLSDLLDIPYKWLDKERDWRDWAWIGFGWFIYPVLIGCTIVLVIHLWRWWYSW